MSRLNENTVTSIFREGNYNKRMFEVDSHVDEDKIIFQCYCPTVGPISVEKYKIVENYMDELVEKFIEKTGETIKINETGRKNVTHNRGGHTGTNRLVHRRFFNYSVNG